MKRSTEIFVYQLRNHKFSQIMMINDCACVHTRCRPELRHGKLQKARMRGIFEFEGSFRDVEAKSFSMNSLLN